MIETYSEWHRCPMCNEMFELIGEPSANDFESIWCPHCHAELATPEPLMGNMICG